MIKKTLCLSIVLIVIINSCSTQTDKNQGSHIIELENFITVDTIRDSSFDDKLVNLDSSLKVKLSEKDNLDNSLDSYKLIALTPKLSEKTILIYSAVEHSTKLVTLDDEMNIIDVHEVAYSGANRTADGYVEIIEKYSIFNNDSIITINHIIDNIESGSDTVSSDKELYILSKGRIKNVKSPNSVL